MDNRQFPPAAYLLALVCFLLPFAELSCQGKTLASFTGIELATGTTVQEPQMFGPPKQRPVPADGVVILALAAVITGLVLAALSKGVPSRPSGIAGVVALLALLMFKSQAEQSILRQGGGLIVLQLGPGYWGATLFSVIGAALGLFSRVSSATPDSAEVDART